MTRGEKKDARAVALEELRLAFVQLFDLRPSEVARIRFECEMTLCKDQYRTSEEWYVQFTASIEGHSELTASAGIYLNLDYDTLKYTLVKSDMTSQKEAIFAVTAHRLAGVTCNVTYRDELRNALGVAA